MDKSIAVTVTSDDGKRYTRVFSTSCPISFIFTWATNMGVVLPTVNDFEFSDYTGESS